MRKVSSVIIVALVAVIVNGEGYQQPKPECRTEYQVVNKIVNKEEFRNVCNPVTKYEFLRLCSIITTFKWGPNRSSDVPMLKSTPAESDIFNQSPINLTQYISLGSEKI